jgi:DNA-binding CsgD family transcriptional regulator
MQLLFAYAPTPVSAFDLKLDKLTSREHQILHLVGQGYTNRRVADEFTISIPRIFTSSASLRVILLVSQRDENDG